MTFVSVKEWMSGDPVSIDAEASASEALSLMSRRNIRHLPVVDATKRVVGVLSFDDLRAGLAGPISLEGEPSDAVRREALEWRVAELMTDAPIVVTEEDALATAADRMADARIGCLPVVDSDGRLVAMLSETDALRALAASSPSDPEG